MATFGTTKIFTQNANDGCNFGSTFKIQGQMYHQICFLILIPDADIKFLQVLIRLHECLEVTNKYTVLI